MKQSKWIVRVTVVVLTLGLLPLAAAAQPVPQSLTEWAALGLPVPPAPPPAPAAPPPAPSVNLVYYTTRADFDAAYPGLPVEDFEEGQVGPGEVVACPHPVDANGSLGCFLANQILPGVAFWASADHAGEEMALVGAGFGGNASKNLVTNYFADTFRIVFDRPVLAAGMDLEAYCVSDTCTLTVYDALGLPIETTDAPCAEYGPFWGVGSDVPIGQITITSPGSLAEGVDNFAIFAPLTCGDFDYRLAIDPYGRFILRWRVHVVDHAGAPVGWVVTWAKLRVPSIPNWIGPIAKLSHPVTGGASFPWGSSYSGLWQIDVTGMSQAGYTFVDGANCSAELEAR